jgi:hypothetical protein
VPSQQHGKSAFRVCWFRPRTYFSGEALASRIGSSKNTVIEVGLRGLPINGNRDRVDAMAHLDHKESTVYPHCERDVSKDPFHPPGIVKLDLKKTPKIEPAQPCTPPIRQCQTPKLTRGVYHCGERQKFITSTEESAAICGTNCALKLPKRYHCSKRSPVHIHTLRCARLFACVCGVRR